MHGLDNYTTSTKISNIPTNTNTEMTVAADTFCTVEPLIICMHTLHSLRDIKVLKEQIDQSLSMSYHIIINILRTPSKIL